MFSAWVVSLQSLFLVSWQKQNTVEILKEVLTEVKSDLDFLNNITTGDVETQ